MRVFVIGSSVPFRHHDRPGVTAVHIVTYLLIREIALAGHRVAYQMLFNRFRGDRPLDEAEAAELGHLRSLGIDTLQPVFEHTYVRRRSSRGAWRHYVQSTRQLFTNGGIGYYYPAAQAASLVAQRIRSLGTDAILTVWSPEGVAATFGYRGCPKVVYHGDLDHTHALISAQSALAGKSEIAGSHVRAARERARARLQLLRVRGFERAHLAAMRDVDCVANVTASNAAYYATHGHPRSTYARNTWLDMGSSTHTESAQGDKPPVATGRPVKIIGHVGRLSATGSTYGLQFLAKEVGPALRQVMHEVPYEVHIIGAGIPAADLRRELNQPNFILRGFVDDLDAELRSCDVFLMLNNAGPYRAAFTRHIVAWSMSLCMVVHAGSSDAIPEISHGENCLVGRSGTEIAEAICLAARDRDLNRQVRVDGRATYERHFTPRAVASGLIDTMTSLTSMQDART